MIKAVNVSKSFGAETLFTDISVNINPGERVGLVGRNGHGKTTLLRLITGQESPDTGSITVPRDYRLGFLPQTLNFSGETILDEACLGLPDFQRHEHWRAEKVLSGLGFDTPDLRRSPHTFSGGFQVRLSLAKVILSNPDALLLDEPTNFLDVLSIRWLTGFLNQWKGELILITHDRSFMDSVTTHIMGIHRKKLIKMPGSTEKYYQRIETEEAVHENTRRNEEKKRRETEEFINRFRAKARLANLVQSRIKTLEKQAPREKLQKIETLDFSFQYQPFSAKTPLQASGLTFGYRPGAPLVGNLDLTVNKNDRIAVIGKNGSGKTTLLRLLAGDLEPEKGTVTVHPAAQPGYYAQTNRRLLNESQTIEQWLMAAGCKRQKARDICGTMMFSGDRAEKRIGVLSGGEKSRVLLGRLLASPVNLLLLDEPTNHLDMDSCNTFLKALEEFPGAVIIVTHNEMFLHYLANRLIVFQEGGVRIFEGSYRDFLEKVGWEEESRKTEAGGPKAAPAKSLDKKALRQRRAEILSARSAAVNPLKKQISETENAIEEKESEAGDLNGKLSRASAAGDGARIAELSRRHHTLQSEIENLYERLETLTHELETLKADYERQLSGLDKQTSSNRSPS